MPLLYTKSQNFNIDFHLAWELTSRHKTQVIYILFGVLNGNDRLITCLHKVAYHCKYRTIIMCVFWRFPLDHNIALRPQRRVSIFTFYHMMWHTRADC